MHCLQMEDVILGPTIAFLENSMGTVSATADAPIVAYELCNFIYTICCLNDKFNSSLKELIHCKLLVVMQIVMEIVMEHTKATKECNAAHASKSLVLLTFEKGDLVLKDAPFSAYMGKFNRNWHGPYCITGIQKPSTISVVNIFDPTDFDMVSSCHLERYWTLFIDMPNDLKEGKFIIDLIAMASLLSSSATRFVCFTPIHNK